MSLPIKNSLLSFLGGSYLRLVGLTSRISWVGLDIRRHLETTENGFLYAFWHGRQAFLPYLQKGDKNVRPLISRSKDGDIMARVCRSFGIETVRGSSSKGGVGALLEIERLLNAGIRVGISPDGPRGPLRQVGGSIIEIARRTGRPIVPLAYSARKRWILGSWDEFIFPKPFNHVAMVYGEPMRVRPTDNAAEKAAELKTLLDRVMIEADRVVDAG